MITYAQNFEDVLLARIFRHKPYGFYIDVGAHDPVDLSVTKYFYDLGWHGINIEPVPSNHKRFLEQRPRDINLNMAAGECSGVLTLHVVRGQTPYVADGTALSTFLDDLAPKAAAVMGGHPVEDIQVDVRTLAEICDASCREPIDFLKIDVEGWEKQVIEGADFVQFRPQVLVIEATAPNVAFQGFDKIEAIAGWHEWEPILLNANYHFAYFDGLNRFYVRGEDATTLLPLFALPVGLYDGVEVSDPRWVAPVLRERLGLESEAARRTTSFIRQIARFEAERRSVDEQLQAEIMRAEDLSVRVKAFVGQIARLEAERRTVEEQLHLETARAENLEARAAIFNKEMIRFETVKSSLNDQLQSALAQIEASELQRSSLCNQLSNLAVAKGDLENQQRKSQASINTLAQECAASLATIEQLTTAANEQVEKLAALRREQADAALRSAATEAHLQEAELRLEEAAAARRELALKLSEVNAENHNLQEHLTELESANKGLETSGIELRGENEALQRTLADREKALSEATQALAQIEDENRDLANRVAAAEQRFSLLRAMAREHTFRRKHRLRLALLRWLPPLARLRYRVAPSDLNEASLDDLLRVPRLTATSAQVESEPPAEVAPPAQPKESEASTESAGETAVRQRPAPAKARKSGGRLKISVITPSFNSGDTLERAIRSVQEQSYTNFEHWIIDGGSRDDTLDILKRYPHLKWVSDPDKGQADAMNKGFARATGDIIVYLNADDEFLPEAFAAVIPAFQAGAQIVMGRVRVVQEKDNLIWENDPRTDFAGMLRHWEMNAFCVNPVGYFYRKEVQQQAPFNTANDDKMDLEFLLDVAARFEIVKVEATLGVFHYAVATKTGQEQAAPNYWQPANFPFVNHHAKRLPPAAARRFELARALGYQQRRAWTIREMLVRTPYEELRQHPEIVILPPIGGEKEVLLTADDAIFVTFAVKPQAAALWQPLAAALLPEIPLRHLSERDDLAPLRHFIARHGKRVKIHLLLLGDAAGATRLLANLLGQAPAKKVFKEQRSINNFVFQGVTIAVVAPDKAPYILPRLAAQWSGAATTVV